MPDNLRSPKRGSLGRAWKQRLRRRVLLTWPALYAIDRVKYERSLTREGEIEALLSKLDGTLTVPGAIVECGSFLCGTTACMALHLQKSACDKHIYACDTFEGFDPREFADERERGDASPDHGFTDNDIVYVRRKLERLGVSHQITLVQGLFQETLESVPGPFSFSFIDCDLQDSLLYAVRTVWPRLSPGGCCVFDDYANDRFLGATKAIETFVDEHAHSIRAHGPLSHKMYFAHKRES